MTRTLCLKLSALVLCLFAALQVNAQCDCDFYLSDLLIPGKNIVEGRNVPPGSVVCLNAATPRNGNLLFKRFNGTPTAPITLINCGGKYTVNSGTLSFAIKFFGSSYFRLTGSGDPSVTHGIEVNGGSQGVSVDSLSTNFEIDHLDIHGQNFAGIMAKTDPDCNANTWRENFTMYDIRIHDNYIHSTSHGEGLYIGNSFYANGMSRTCGETTIRVYPHAIVGAKIYNNTIFDTGADGIQVGSATQGCEIYDNRIERHGQRPFDNRNDQGNGIQIGEGTGGLCYNNFILNIPPVNEVDRTGYSIICLGRGDNVVFNNIMINPSNGGMFIDERGAATITGPGSGYKIINNTIINPKNNGLLLYSELVEQNVVKNNIIVNPQLKYIAHSTGVKIDSAGNYETRDINTVQFSNPSAYDYHLTSSSPAIGYGVDVSSYGVTFDFDHVARPAGAGWDAGAFEFPDETPQDWTVYINAGGDTVDNQWELDKQTQPHAYLDTTYPSLTTGSASSFSGINNTDAPNAVLGSYRYTSGSNTTIQYNIPVPEANKTYQVSLYFAKKGSDTFTSGQRRFNVFAEGNLVTTYDVYDSTLTGADSYSFTTQVSDNVLQLKFVALSGAHAHINAIAVIKAVTTNFSLAINAGGDPVDGDTIIWERDKQTQPHSYLDTSYPTLATGSASTYSGVNNTNAPNAVMGSYRYTSGSNNTIRYTIPVPVANARYRVELFFGRKNSDVFTSGTKRFNILIEGQQVTTYDVYDASPTGVSSYISPSVLVDDSLEISLVALPGAQALISGVYISGPVQNAMSMASAIERSPVSLYPNPVSSFLGIAVDPNNSYTISISDARNQVYATWKVSGEEHKQVDISALPENQIYYVHILSADGKKETHKVVKSQR